MALPPRASTIGYARVSSPDQQLDAQLDALQQVGGQQGCADRVRGMRTERPGWEQLRAYVRPGAAVVVTELSRLSRSLLPLLAVVQTWAHRRIDLLS